MTEAKESRGGIRGGARGRDRRIVDGLCAVLGLTCFGPAIIIPLVASELRLQAHARAHEADAPPGEDRAELARRIALGGSLLRLLAALILCALAVVAFVVGGEMLQRMRGQLFVLPKGIAPWAEAAQFIALMQLIMTAPVLFELHACRAKVRAHEARFWTATLDALDAEERIARAADAWRDRYLRDLAVSVVALLPGIGYVAAIAAVVRISGALELHERHEVEPCESRSAREKPGSSAAPP